MKRFGLVTEKVGQRNELERMPRGALLANQRGAMLILLIIVIVVLAVLAVAMMRQTSTGTYNELFANREARAYYLAEAGGRHGLKVLNEGGDPTGTYTLGQGNTFTLSTSAPGDGSTLLTSLGVVNSGVAGDWLEAESKIIYRYTPSPPPPNVTFTNGSEARLGVYAPGVDVFFLQDCTCTGTFVGNHVFEGDPASMAGGTEVFYSPVSLTGLPGGFAFVVFANSTDANAVGLYGDPTMTGQYGTNGQVFFSRFGIDLHLEDKDPTENAGLVLPPPPASPIFPGAADRVSISPAFGPTVSLSAGAYSWKTINMTGINQLNLNDGVILVADTIGMGNISKMNINGNVLLVASQITLGGMAQLNITGNMTIIVDNMYTRNGFKVNVTAGSTLRVFVNHEVRVEGDSRINATGAPDQCIFYATAVADDEVKENVIQYFSGQ